jgi:hypothetical protein
MFCRCSRETATARFEARADTRAVGHFDRERDPVELWDDEVSVPGAAGWSVIEVNTETEVDLEPLVRWVLPLDGAPLARSIPGLRPPAGVCAGGGPVQTVRGGGVDRVRADGAGAPAPGRFRLRPGLSAGRVTDRG